MLNDAQLACHPCRDTSFEPTWRGVTGTIAGQLAPCQQLNNTGVEPVELPARVNGMRLAASVTDDAAVGKKILIESLDPNKAELQKSILVSQQPANLEQLLKGLCFDLATEHVQPINSTQLVELIRSRRESPVKHDEVVLISRGDQLDPVRATLSGNGLTLTLAPNQKGLRNGDSNIITWQGHASHLRKELGIPANLVI